MAPRVAVPVPRTMSLVSVICTPVGPEPPMAVTVLKSLLAVFRMISPRGAVRVARLVDVIAPVWVIEPPVEVTLRTGAVVAASAMLPPLESEKPA